MSRSHTVTNEQAQKIRKNWNRISRMGLPLYVLAFGSAMLLWMCLCFVGFTYLNGTQRLLHESFVIESTLPCMAFLSYLAPVAYYISIKTAIKRVGQAEA
jgi:hypothetical protein